jgi:hypothetical protein
VATGPQAIGDRFGIAAHSLLSGPYLLLLRAEGARLQAERHAWWLRAGNLTLAPPPHSAALSQILACRWAAFC